ncbi:complement factor H-like [Xiphias gladius]|uniref:complement factor H-like n=1 Tax=Xiphias gladius TaxID=8245 RepID=UPI001A980C33|nr:complement factor H-like [Xiphias gladius]
MHIIIRSLVLFLWMHTLTLVKSQDCTLEEFLNGPLYDSNFDTTTLDATYSGGRQVRVGCNVGFSGFFKLVCVEGNWQSRGSKCQPRSCGHPGDAQFSDFQLEKGDDFVFGSQVIYTCHKGYQMVSRTNRRRCMAEGWDGVLPVCEAQQCPVIHVNNNVQVIGDPEEAIFGNVLQFTCKSGSEVLFGPSQIYCNENGDWSDEAPKCKVIKCTVPVIENGYVPGNIQEYNEHEFLNFVCAPKYKPSESRQSRCTKIGSHADWSPTPSCEPIRCKIILPPTDGTTYEPDFKNVFSPGDLLKVSCGAKYWISNVQDTSAEVTCQEDGEWSTRPLCKEVTCTTQRPQFVNRWYIPWQQPVTLGQTLNYNCRQGYRRKDGATFATCTRNGWMPFPLCEAITCDRLDIHNADIIKPKQIYRLNEYVNYVCNEGYEGKFHITCTEYGWSSHPPCREITCNVQYFNNADIEGHVQSVYKYNDQVEYVCKSGFQGRFSLTCKQEGWIGSRKCTGRRCIKPYISDAYITSNDKQSYGHGEKVKYRCTHSEEKVFTVTCVQGVWAGIKSCTGCPSVEILHGFTVGPYNGTLYYTCDEGYKLFTKGWWSVAKCNGSAWTGLEKCIEKSKCGELPVIPNGEVKHQHDNLRQEETLAIVCNEGYNAELDHLTCLQGKWHSNGKSLKTICAPIVKPCHPPPKVENAVVVGSYQREYLSGSEVTYLCRDNYTMEGEATATCNNGEWEKRDFNCRAPLLPENWGQTHRNFAQKTEFVIGVRLSWTLFAAAHPLAEMRLSLILLLLQLWGHVKVSLSQNACATLPDVPNGHVSEETKKAEYQEGDQIHFACETGYISGPTITYSCSREGWVAVRQGSCYLRPCQLPDDTPNGYYQIIHGDDFVFGATIKYFCNEGYQMVSKEDVRTCLLDRWTNHVPVCDPLSCDPPLVDDKITVKGLPENEEPILPDRFLRFSCDGPGKYLNGSSLLTCGKDGKWDNPFPSCEDITCMVGTMHPNLSADGLVPGNENVKAGHRLRFRCNDEYRLEGSEVIQCLQTGQWSAAFPTCIDTCKVTGVPNNVHLRTHAPGNQLTPGQKLRFSCRLRSHFIQGKAEVECLENGEWSHPFPTCGAPSGCERPPPLDNGDTRETQKYRYAHNERVEYVCQKYYTMQGGPFKTCNNGDWTGEMRCLKPCTVDTEVMNKNNIAFRYTYEKKLYSTHLDYMEFACTRGRRLGTVAMRQRCIDGVIVLPTCL